MVTQPDFKELLALLNVHSVKFIIVGAHALAFHGAPRYTGDLHIFVEPSAENAKSMMDALSDFGFGGLGITEADFSKPDMVVQLGCPPVRIDIMTSISGVTWDEADKSAVPSDYGSVPVRFIGKEAYKKNKRESGGNKDLADIEALQEE